MFKVNTQNVLALQREMQEAINCIQTNMQELSERANKSREWWVGKGGESYRSIYKNEEWSAAAEVMKGYPKRLEEMMNAYDQKEKEAIACSENITDGV